MKITRENLLELIQTGIKREALSISGLEKLAGVPKDTIRDFLRGKTQILRADKLQKISLILSPAPTVSVIGCVGKEGEIFASETEGTVDCPPGFEPFDVKAVRIRGDAMEPVFHDGWVVYYTWKSTSPIPVISGGWQVPYNPSEPKNAGAQTSYGELLGKPCVIKLSDDRLMLRTLKQGTKPDHYNLIAYNADDIENATIDWAAKIVFIKTS